MVENYLTKTDDINAVRSVKLINKEIQGLSKALSSIKIDKSFADQINALSKNYNNLVKAAIKINESLVKQYVIEAKTFKLIGENISEILKDIETKAKTEKIELSLTAARQKAILSIQKQNDLLKQNTELNSVSMKSIFLITKEVLKSHTAINFVLNSFHLLQDVLFSINETLVKTRDNFITLKNDISQDNKEEIGVSGDVKKTSKSSDKSIVNLSKNTGELAEKEVPWVDNFKGILSTVQKVIDTNNADKIAKEITSWSSLSRTIEAQSESNIIDYTSEIKRLQGEILTTVDSEVLLQKQTELLSLKQQGLASVLKNVSTAMSVMSAVVSVIDMIQTTIDEAKEKHRQEEQERLQLQNEAIANAVESIDNNKELVQSTNEYAESIQELREILYSSTASENEKQAAQTELLSIQNCLVESNGAYAGSLDLVNGKLGEQLNLVEKMSDAQLKQEAQDFLDDKYVEIANANSAVNDKSSTIVELFSGNAYVNETDKNKVNKIIDYAKNKGIDLSSFNDIEAPDFLNPIIYYEELSRNAAQGEETTVWDWLGFSGINNVVSGKAFIGESQNGIAASGTVEERITKLEDLKKIFKDDYANLGLSYTDSLTYVKKLNDIIAQINTSEYQNAKILAEKSKAMKDFINGDISREKYLEIVYGIENKVIEEENGWSNNISKVTSKYDGLISKLEELRDLQKESTEWEEKKLDVIKAERVLEDAKNEATVRRFNQATGQWEWQSDEKKIAEAEKNLEQAKHNLQEAAYGNIIDQLKEQTATNESIFAILKEVAPLLGEDFSSKIQIIIKNQAGVDVAKPSILSIGNYDNGGLAFGKGFINKATNRPESVNNPELTKKILSPVSNAEFNRYVQDMGIMFERARQYSQAPIIERTGRNIDNRINNSGQVIMNGVAIGSDKRSSSLEEILSLAKIVPNL